MGLRILRVFKFDALVFREVAEDPSSIVQGLVLVVSVGLAMGLGLTTASIESGNTDEYSGSLGLISGLWVAVMGTLVGWVLWGLVVYIMGIIFMHGGVTLQQILRVLSIGFTPGILLVMIGVPIVGPASYLLGSLAVLISGIVGVHEIQDTDWIGAVLSVGLGWLIPFFAMPWLVVAPSLT